MRLKMKKIKIGTIFLLVIGIFSLSVISMQKDKNTISTSSEQLSNKKIGWGIKRNDNHDQPDVGADRKKVLEANNGISVSYTHLRAHET